MTVTSDAGRQEYM